MEKYDVNRDKFIDFMYTHRLDAGTNVAKLWTWAQEGHDIRPLARVFIIDRLCQCLAAWECAAGVWTLDSPRDAKIDPEKWEWAEFLKEIKSCIDEIV